MVFKDGRCALGALPIRENADKIEHAADHTNAAESAFDSRAR
jgi:hypothetical protein